MSSKPRFFREVAYGEDLSFIHTPRGYFTFSFSLCRFDVMMNKWKIIAILLVLTSCGRNPSQLTFQEREHIPGGGFLIPGDAPVSFESVQDYILKPKCMSCHSGPDAKPSNDPIDFTTYESTMEDRFIPLLIKGDPENSRLYEAVETGDMPVEGTLSNKEIEFIRDWIVACAPKKAQNSIPTNCSDDGDGDDDEPGGDGPGGDEPGSDEPGSNEPGSDEPGSDEPGSDEPGSDEPGSDEPGNDEPGF